MAVVVTNIRRPDPALVDAFGAFGVSTVHEARGRTGQLAPRISPIFPGVRIAGTAVTVRVPPNDNWMIHVAVEQTQPGDIVVVAPTSRSEAGYFGELLASALKARGVRGLVIDAGCRDVAELREMRFPVWSRCVSPAGTIKASLGDVNVPIVCGGQVVDPGDIVVADEDGVVVVPQDDASRVLAACQERVEREDRTRSLYQEGVLSLDLHGMRDKLAAAGLTYVDQETYLASGNR